MYRLLFTLAIAAVAGLQTASAGLILETFEQFSGAGLGSVTTILTIQDSPSEMGCISFGGATGSSMSSGACTGSAAGVKTGSSQTQTRTLADVGITSASDFALVFNASEPAGGSITLNDLTATFYSPSGTLLYATSGLACQSSAGGVITPAGAGGCNIGSTAHGIGNSGFVIILDAAQSTAATSAGAFNNPNNVIGLAARATSSQGGPDTFYVASLASLFPETEPAPEPSSFGLLAVGLGAIAWLRAKRSN